MRVLLSLVNSSSEHSINSNNSELSDNCGDTIVNNDNLVVDTNQRTECTNTFVAESAAGSEDRSIATNPSQITESLNQNNNISRCNTTRFETTPRLVVTAAPFNPRPSLVANSHCIDNPSRLLDRNNKRDRSIEHRSIIERIKHQSSEAISVTSSTLNTHYQLDETNRSVDINTPSPSPEASASSIVAPNLKLKRPRIGTDCELLHTSSYRLKMAVGGRGKNDSDDETSTAVDLQHPPRRYWVEPAENEPPIIAQNDTCLELSPTDYDDLPLPHVAETGSSTVLVASSSEDESSEKSLLAIFLNAIKKRGLEMIEQEGDGNCLFRAVSLQVYGSSDNHGEVRERCMDYIAKNEEHFINFIAACSDDEVAVSFVNGAAVAFQAYIARKRTKGVHGNHTEIQAISELYNRPVEVYAPETCDAETEVLQPMNIFHEEYKTSDPPIRLSYHDGNHYNAIIDPIVPTAGLGLGMPDLKVGLADKMQVMKAITESDQLADELDLQRILKESQEEVTLQTDRELQKVLNDSCADYMYEKKIVSLSDFDETNFSLEQKVLASSMETYFRQEHGRKQRATVSSVGSSSRRRRCSPPPREETMSEPSTSNVSSMSTAQITCPPATVTSSSHDKSSDSTGANISTNDYTELDEEYPQVVQELVMNGFELQDVIRAYDFVGDRFDDLISFLLSPNK